MTRYTNATSAASNLTTLACLENTSRSHINQCPLCSRAFESLLVLSDHVNKEHVDALQRDQKKCPFCDAGFDTFDELSIHCKEHRLYSCDICYTGFISEPLLVEHCFNDHPQG